MKQFACRSLGNNCNWKHIANTEELLADVVAVHLRDVHGTAALSQEVVGKIKTLFTDASPAEARAAESLVLKEYRCSLGPGCGWHYIAQTEDLITDGVAIHAREKHNIREFTPAMITTVKNSLHEWRG